MPGGTGRDSDGMSNAGTAGLGRRSVTTAVVVPAIAVLAALTFATGASVAGSFPPSEGLLPAATRVWVSVADPLALKARFERSALGGLVYDPLMSTFLDGLRQQGRASADPLRGSLEITLEEVDRIAGGEIAMAVVEQPDGLLATVLLVDTEGRETRVKEVVDAVRERVAAKGAKSVATPPGIEAFAVPVAAATTGDAPPRHLVISVSPKWLVMGDRLDAAVDLIAAVGRARGAGGGGGPTLASLPAFATVAERCGKNVPAMAATVRWFVDPLPYLAADRRTYPPKKTRKGPDYATILRRQGFDAVTGVGGCLFFGEGQIDLRHNTLIHAPPQGGRPADGPDRFQKAARMLHFPNASGLAPAPWVPGTSASWFALQWDIANAFDALPPLVDEIVGEQGVFEDVIASLQEDPDGPQIDVREGLVRQLGSRCMVATDHVGPIDADCERMLISIETKNPEAVAAVLAKGMTSEGDVRTVEVGGHTIWETIKRAAAADQGPGVAADTDETASRRRARQRERQENDSLWPNLSVAVAHGHVLLASHRDFLERVLADDGASEIIEAGDYQDVAAELRRLLGGEWALSSFSRTERAIRPAYELLRAGRLSESKSLAGTVLRRLLEGGNDKDPKRPDATPRQQVDGSSLPEFDQIRQYFGVNGMSMQSTPDGWYLVGVGLWNGGKENGGAPSAAATDRESK